MTPTRPAPPDAAARDRIREDTAAILFVDAGAGSGKTTTLVDRFTTLVLRDGVPVRQIAAVTFTEKAGAELRDRLRGEFERRWRADRDTKPESVEGRRRERHQGGAMARRRREGRPVGLSSAGNAASVPDWGRAAGGDPRIEAKPGGRAEQALNELDAAAIGTLHSFCQRILTLHPIEAGLPPLIEVLDEVGSSVAFDNRWSVMQRELLDDEQLAPAVRLALAAGVKLEHLRSLARAFSSEWDRIDQSGAFDPGSVAAALPDLTDLVKTATALAARAAECSAQDDRFLGRLEALGGWVSDYADARDAESVLSALSAAERLTWRDGQKKNWKGVLDEVRGSCKEWQQQASEARARLLDAALRPLADWIARRVAAAARSRAAEGRLEFHDLLVMARDLLRGDAEVRASLQAQFRCLLLDEFQDTDPIQVEVAVRIAGGAAAADPDWAKVAVPEGSLFFVGDPKQSIYRFRRADIGLFLEARSRFGDVVTLNANFRTTAPVLDWLNTVFGDLIQPVEGAQPGYVPLAATRKTPEAGPAVVVLGETAHDDRPTAAQLREREAADVAGVVTAALTQGWTTHDERGGTSRPVELGDIAVLVPARTSLPFLEDALDAAGIPYRAESSSLVYQASEVRDLLAAARAVADPSDLLSCVSALRSPLFGCGDDDLWTWRHAGGSFNLLSSGRSGRADEETHPVGKALAYLRSLAYRARWMAPSEVLSALVADRRMLEVAATRPRPRDQWRRLRFVVDQARAWSETEHGGLRGYLAWAARQGEETSRVAEAVLPETDVDAVRVMTVHAAKGLEFPVVVLSGMSSQPRSNGGVRVLWSDHGYEVRLSKAVQTNDFENVAPVDEQMDAYERRRLLYVATTRARDHLVVSLHRRAGAATNPTNADLLAGAGAAGAAGAVSYRAGADLAAVPRQVATPAVDLPAWDDWRSEIERVRRRARQAGAISASGLEGTEPDVVLAPDREEQAGRAKGSRDLELPPWSKGRYGTAIGRAVHGVLQSVALAGRTGHGVPGEGTDVDGAVAAQCVAEGVSEFAEVVRGLVRSALASDVVRRAAARDHWRETYVGTVGDDGVVVEGFVDLVYREDDGRLVVVDYKTDAVPAQALATRATFYAPQLRAYQQALAEATGSATEAVLLFLHPSAAARAVPLGAAPTGPATVRPIQR